MIEYLLVAFGYGLANMIRYREEFGEFTWASGIDRVIDALIWPLSALMWADYVFKWGLDLAQRWDRLVLKIVSWVRSDE